MLSVLEFIDFPSLNVFNKCSWKNEGLGIVEMMEKA